MTHQQVFEQPKGRDIGRREGGRTSSASTTEQSRFMQNVFSYQKGHSLNRSTWTSNEGNQARIGSRISTRAGNLKFFRRNEASAPCKAGRRGSPRADEGPRTSRLGRWPARGAHRSKGCALSVQRAAMKGE